MSLLFMLLAVMGANATAVPSERSLLIAFVNHQGEWGSIDHILASRAIYNKVDTAFIHAPKFLLEDEKLYGGFRPRRTYNGMRYQPGYSDHLPLVVRLRLTPVSALQPILRD